MRHQALVIFILFPLISLAQPAVHWRKAIKNGVQSVNLAAAIQTDKSGNVYVAGTTNEVDSSKKIMLMKLDSGGVELWRRIYTSQNHSDAVAIALAVDDSGNAILTGTTKNISANTDIVTLKYSPEGILVWENIYAGKANLFDAPSAIAADKKGNVFVCGYETASDANPDLVLIRYASLGAKSFVKNFATSKMDIGADVVTDDSCNVYICGSMDVSTRTGDIIAMKYDSSGNSKWYYVYDGTQRSVDMAADISMDDSTFICITGYANHSNDRSDIPVIRLNRNGKVICEQVISEGVSDGTGNSLKVSGKSILVHAAFTDYLQQTTSNYIYIADKSCNAKFRFQPASEDVVYLEAAPWQNNSTLLFGTIISRPENTVAPYIELRDSLRSAVYSYQDSILISLLRIKDVLLTGRAIYFLGDDATSNAGTISVVKYMLPEEPKKKTKVTNPIKK